MCPHCFITYLLIQNFNHQQQQQQHEYSNMSLYHCRIALQKYFTNFEK